jgi:hypothetical protein
VGRLLRLGSLNAPSGRMRPVRHLAGSTVATAPADGRRQLENDRRHQPSAVSIAAAGSVPTITASSPGRYRSALATLAINR